MDRDVKRELAKYIMAAVVMSPRYNPETYTLDHLAGLSLVSAHELLKYDEATACTGCTLMCEIIKRHYDFVEKHGQVLTAKECAEAASTLRRGGVVSVDKTEDGEGC